MEHNIAITNPEEIRKEIESLNVIFDGIETPWMDAMSEEDQRLVDQSYAGIYKGSAFSIRVLKKLIRKYPNIPTLKNNLYKALSVSGDVAFSERFADQLLKEHPDYLFGRINLAGAAIVNKTLERVPKILGESLQLSKLRPEQEGFHFSEVVGFYKIVGLYFTQCGELKAAMGVMEGLLHHFDDDEEGLDILRHQITRLAIERNMEEYEAEEEKRIAVSVLEPKPSDELPLPNYNHPEVNNLYCFGFDFPEEHLQHLLGLPRKSAIEDLKKLLAYGVSCAHLPFIESDEKTAENALSLIHGINLLGELGAHEALAEVLLCFSPHDTVVDYWFEGVSNREFFEGLYPILNQNLDDVKEWMLRPGISAVGRDRVSSVVAKIALYYPDRRSEVLAWFESILNVYRETPPEDNVIDTNLISNMIRSLIEIGAKEQETLISSLFEKDYINKVLVGDLEQVRENLQSPSIEMEPIRKIGQRYLEIIEDIHEEADEPEEFGFVEPGRNDPCYCGSGKKYKKCCMNTNKTLRPLT